MTDTDTGDAGQGDAGQAEAVVEAPPAAVAATGYKKGFYINSADGNYALSTKLRLQGRYVGEITDPGTGKELTDSNFRVNRARLVMSGHALTPKLKYKFQLAMDKGGLLLKDMLFDYTLMDNIVLRGGLYKRPFSRSYVGSSSKLELVDRSITDRAMGNARDIGMVVHNNYEKSPGLEWAVSVSNGQKADVLGTNYPTKFGPVLVARVGVNVGKNAAGKPLDGYSEPDLVGGPLRFGVGGSVYADLDFDEAGQETRGTVDYIVKVNGISSNGAVFLNSVEGIDGLAAVGFHLQAGMVFAKQHGVAARFAMINKKTPDEIDPTIIIEATDLEAVLGYSYYFYNHNFKWQTDVALLGPDDADLGEEVVMRSQLELNF